MHGTGDDGQPDMTVHDDDNANNDDGVNGDADDNATGDTGDADRHHQHHSQQHQQCEFDNRIRLRMSIISIPIHTNITIINRIIVVHH